MDIVRMSVFPGDVVLDHIEGMFDTPVVVNVDVGKVLPARVCRKGHLQIPGLIPRLKAARLIDPFPLAKEVVQFARDRFKLHRVCDQML